MIANITSLALLAFISSSAFAALKAPLPEFKNEKQLAEWRAEKASESSTRAAAQEPAIYTGKPYLASSGSYAFRHRAYNPEMARWTSEDPSGFPDGANVNTYLGGAVTNSFDPDGLKRVMTIESFSLTYTNLWTSTPEGSSREKAFNDFSNLLANKHPVGNVETPGQSTYRGYSDVHKDSYLLMDWKKVTSNTSSQANNGGGTYWTFTAVISSSHYYLYE